MITSETLVIAKCNLLELYVLQIRLNWSSLSLDFCLECVIAVWFILKGFEQNENCDSKVIENSVSLPNSRFKDYLAN